jgi:hypothetical protein
MDEFETGGAQLRCFLLPKPISVKFWLINLVLYKEKLAVPEYSRRNPIFAVQGALNYYNEPILLNTGKRNMLSEAAGESHVASLLG